MSDRRTRGIKASTAKSKENGEKSDFVSTCTTRGRQTYCNKSKTNDPRAQGNLRKRNSSKVQVESGVSNRSNGMRNSLENLSTSCLEINANVTKTKGISAPEINVWEQRRAKHEAMKEMLPYNSDHEEIMIKQAILLSQQQLIEDERRKRQKENEYELQLKYLASFSCTENVNDDELSKELCSQVCEDCDAPNLVNKKSTARKLIHPISTVFEAENCSLDQGMKLEAHQFKQFSETCDTSVSLNDDNESQEVLSFLNNDQNKVDSEMKGFCEKTSDVQEAIHSVANEDKVYHSLLPFSQSLILTEKSFIGIKNIKMGDLDSGVESTSNVKGHVEIEKKMPMLENIKNLGNDESIAECPSFRKLVEKNQCNQYYLSNPNTIAVHNETLKDNLNCNSLESVPDFFISQTEVDEVKQNILYETNDMTKIDNALSENFVVAEKKKANTDNASRKGITNCNPDCATVTMADHETVHKMKDEYSSSNWYENLETCNKASDNHLKIPEACMTPDVNLIHDMSQSVPNSLNTTSLTFEHSYGSFSPGFPNSTLSPTDMIAGSLPMTPGFYLPLLWQQMMMNSNPFFAQQLQMLQMCYAQQNPFLPMTHLPVNRMGMTGYPQNSFSLSNTNSHIPVFASLIPQETETIPEVKYSKSLSPDNAMDGINNSYISHPDALETKVSRLNINSVASDHGKQPFSKDSVDNLKKMPVCNPENSDSSVEHLASEFINSPSLSHSVRQQSNISSDCQSKSYTSQFFGTSEPSAVENCNSEESRRRKLHMKFFGDSDISFEVSEPMPCIKPPRQVAPDRCKRKSVKLEPIRQPKQNPKHILHSMIHQDLQSIKKKCSAIPTINSQQNMEKCFSNQTYPLDEPTHLSQGNEKICNISLKGSSQVTQNEDYNDKNCDLIAFSNERLKPTLNSNILEVKASAASRKSEALLVGGEKLTDKNMQLKDTQGDYFMNSKALTFNEDFSYNEWNDTKNPEDLSTKKNYGSGIWDDDDSNYSSCSSIDNLRAISHDSKHCSDNRSQPVCLSNTRWPRNANSTKASNVDLKHACRNSITIERNSQNKEERIAKPLSTVQKLFKKSCRKPNC